MAADLVIRSTRVITDAGVTAAAIHVAGGRILRIAGHHDFPRNVPVDDLRELAVMAGLVDTHVHFNDPGRDEWEGFPSGTAAAAAGGVTTIVDMPLNSVPATTTASAFEKKRAAASGRVYVDVAFWGGIVPGNIQELPALAALGVAGFKAFLAPSGVDEFPAVGEGELRAALPALAAAGLPLLVHAESADVIAEAVARVADRSAREYATWLASRPDEAEQDAIDLVIGLCREFRTPVHVVHLATALALPAIRAARADGVRVSVETCPHYLTFAAGDIPDGGMVFKCAPPIRGEANREALWSAVMAGEIDLIATDHSPCPPEMKSGSSFLEAWGGIASLELGLAAVWTGGSRRGLSLSQLPRLLCSAPAALAGLHPRKGVLAPGADADLVVWDPDEEFTVDESRLFQRHKISPYDGLRLRGVVHRTYLRGRIVHQRSVPAASLAPQGQLLARGHS